MCALLFLYNYVYEFHTINIEDNTGRIWKADQSEKPNARPLFQDPNGLI